MDSIRAEIKELLPILEERERRRIKELVKDHPEVNMNITVINMTVNIPTLPTTSKPAEIETMGIIEQSTNFFKPTRYESGFIGENLRLEEFSSLTEEQKIQLDSLLWEKNKDWLNKKFQELNAAWISVVNGVIVKSSPDICEYPQRKEILKLCEEKAKFPFLFINDYFFMIEEGASIWSKTSGAPDDHYPTTEIQIASLTTTVKLPCDLDTGTYLLFVDRERLISEGLITPHLLEEEGKIYQGSHLNEIYKGYMINTFSVGIILEDGKVIKKNSFPVICVTNWGKSPFVKINKNRCGLVGRGLFLNLKRVILLDFSLWETKIF
ncbi:MAG: hypothetical protein AB1422_16990 [bacterium]